MRIFGGDAACPSTQCWHKKSDRTQECIGRSRGGLTTKIHATCDALGNPTGFHLSPGQAHDLQGADVLLEALLDQIRTLLLDIAYAARARLLDRLEEHQVEAVIPLCAFLGAIHWVAAVIWLN